MEWYGNNGRLTSDPDVHLLVNCDVCGTRMTVRRNVLGATGFDEAMSGHKHRHDVFTCPHLKTAWHEHVVAVIEEGRQFKSLRLRAILQKEIETVLRTRRVSL